MKMKRMGIILAVVMAAGIACLSGRQAQAQVELLIRATANSDWEVGDVVVAKASPATWGGKEGLPDFVRITVTDTTLTQVNNYLQPWYFDLDYTVLQQDSNDGYRVRIENPYNDTSDSAPVTKSQVKNYLESWGMIPVSISATDLRFDFSVFLVLQSESFWGRDVSLVQFIEDSYEPLGRLHTVRADYSATPWAPVSVQISVESAGGTVLQNTGGEIRFAIEGPDVIRRVKEDFHDKWAAQQQPRRHYVSPVVVQAVVDDGGTTTTDKATLLPWMRDRVDE